MPEGVAKRRPLGERLAARVRELVADGRVLRPVRNQPPAVRARDAPAVARGAHDQNVRAGAKVIAALELGHSSSANCSATTSGLAWIA